MARKQDGFEWTYMQNKRSIGNEYERIAGKYLEKHGYQIIEYNFYSRHGEIDIIAKHEGYLVFLEVKFRKDDGAGSPLDAVTVKKQRSISKCAMYYMNKKHLQDVAVRFDVVGIQGNEVTLVQNAFDFIW